MQRYMSPRGILDSLAAAAIWQVAVWLTAGGAGGAVVAWLVAQANRLPPLLVVVATLLGLLLGLAIALWAISLFVHPAAWRPNTAIGRIKLNHPYHIKPLSNPNMCLDVRGQSLEDWATVQIYQDCQAYKPHQRWRLQRSQHLHFAITVDHSKKRLAAREVDDGIVQQAPNNHDTQRWRIERAGTNRNTDYYYLISTHTQKCVSVRGVADLGDSRRSSVVQEDLSGSDRQKWAFVDLH